MIPPRFASRFVFSPLLLSLFACGGAHPAAKTTNVDIPPLAASSSPSRTAVPRPDDVSIWMHASDASTWVALGSTIFDEPTKAASGLFAHTDKILAPNTPVDVTRSGDSKNAVIAVSFTAKDLTETWQTLQSEFGVKVAGNVVVLRPKKKVSEEDEGPTEEKSNDGGAYWCTTSSVKVVCTNTKMPPERLTTWLRSDPVPEGVTGSNLIVDLYGDPLRPELRKVLEKSTSVDANDLVQNFDRARLRLSRGGETVKVSLSVDFRDGARQNPLFATDPRKMHSSRVLSAWPSEATLSLASPGWVALQRLFGESDAEIKVLNRFFAMGTVVDRGEVDTAMQQLEAANDAKTFNARKEKLDRAFAGYTVIGLAETDDVGGKLTVKDVLALERVTKLGKPRPAKSAPPGAVYIPKSVDKAAKLPKPKVDEGTLIFNDGKGAIWILQDNTEAELAVAAKRIAATKDSNVTGWSFDTNTRAIGKWSTAFGSYWMMELVASSATLDTMKAMRASGTSQFSLMKKEAHFEETASTIPVSLTTSSNPPRLELALEATPVAWRSGIRNASVPMTGFLLAFVLAAGTLDQ